MLFVLWLISLPVLFLTGHTFAGTLDAAIGGAVLVLTWILAVVFGVALVRKTRRNL